MLIVMAGLPGTGKSAIAARLGAALAAAVIDKDRIRAALFGPDHIEYSTQQDDFCMAIMLQATAYLLDKHREQHVILDGRTFSRTYQVELLDQFAAQRDIPLKIIQCICADDVALERLTRDVATNAHLADNRTFSLYLTIKANFEAIREPKLSLDTDTDLAACVAECLAYIRANGPTTPLLPTALEHTTGELSQ